MKHPQFILAADAHVFNTSELNQRGITTVDANQFYDNILGHVVVRRRHELDSRSNSLPYRQFLPYDVFSRLTRKFERTFFAFRRKPESGEPELHGKVSIAIGGHADGMNIIWAEDGAPDLPATLALSSMIEKTQELDIYKVLADGTKTLVPDDQKEALFTKWTLRNVTNVNILLFDDNVSLRHFAMVTNTLVPEDFDIRISAKEEDLLESLGFLTYEELTAKQPDGSPVYDLEGWSSICLEHFSKQLATGTKGVSFSGPIDGMQTTELDQSSSGETAPAAEMASSNVGQRIGHGRKLPEGSGVISDAGMALLANVDDTSMLAKDFEGDQLNGTLTLTERMLEAGGYSNVPKSAATGQTGVMLPVESPVNHIVLGNPSPALIDEALRDLMHNVQIPEMRSPSAFIAGSNLDVYALKMDYDFEQELIAAAMFVKDTAALDGGTLVLENFVDHDKSTIKIKLPKLAVDEETRLTLAQRGYLHLTLVRDQFIKSHVHYYLDGIKVLPLLGLTSDTVAPAIVTHSIFAN